MDTKYGDIVFTSFGLWKQVFSEKRLFYKSDILVYVYLAGFADCQTATTPEIDIAHARKTLGLTTQLYKRAIHRLTVHKFICETETPNVFYLPDVKHCYDVFESEGISEPPAPYTVIYNQPYESRTT